MHSLIASPFLDTHLVLRPGLRGGVKIPALRYQELTDAVRAGRPAPHWLADAAGRTWSLDLDLGRPAGDTILIRQPSPYGYARASWEINKGCDYDCDHCYLGLKRFEGLPWEDKVRLLTVMRDAGVLWLQITGGEPLIDRDFPAAYAHAYDLGMMIAISSNGSQLSKPRILNVLTDRRPYSITLSVYGATETSYDGMTRSRGAYGRFTRGLDAAKDADLPVKLNVIVSTHNAHEVDAMKALADRRGFPHQVYTNMSPTIDGSGEPLPTQAADFLRKRKPFAGCNAGHTFFHADPFGKASICKVGRDPQIDLPAEGVEGLRRLGGIADSLMLRTGGCTGCQLSGSCWTCRPLAKLYQEAKAPLTSYCQHGGR
ncbi:radical SAM protein [Streptomyces xiamenensis]